MDNFNVDMIDKSKLGIHKYGEEIAENLRSLLVGKKIVNVEYNYFSESFLIELDDNELYKFEP